MEEKLEMLHRVSIFSELSQKDSEFLLQKMEEKSFSPGEIVVRKGEEGDKLYVILEGEFEVFLSQESLAFEKQLRRLGPGSYFGEVALFYGQKRTANVRALVPSRALLLGRNDLYEIISHSPQIAVSLCRGFALYLEKSAQMEISIQFVKMADYPYNPELASLLPARISAYFKVFPVAKVEKKVTIAMVDPANRELRKFIQEVLPNYILEFVAVSEEDYGRYIQKHLGNTHQLLFADKGDMVVYKSRHGILHSPSETIASNIIDNAFMKAIRSGASDIHIEPSGKEPQIRIRIDGKMMKSDISVDIEHYDQIVSRLKIISEVDISNKLMPQDGSFHVSYGKREIEVRSSFLPCQGGEKVVLRILDPKMRRLDLQSLVLSKPIALLLEEIFLNPHGMVLVTGPTGSGKTTTLYAGLHAIWNHGQQTNIITIEDPVEYQIDFATQVQINKGTGLDFAQILRTVLRQDPNVILVGEIRDKESASIAVESALTGHLVLSSLHTHFALDAIVRLRNLEIEPFLIAGALKGIVSQRLAPRICSSCQTKAEDNPQIREKLYTAGILEKGDQSLWHYGKGCEECRFLGTSGRAGVFEILQVSEALQSAIEERRSKQEMYQMLTSKDFLPMNRYASFLLKENYVSAQDLLKIFPNRVSLEL